MDGGANNIEERLLSKPEVKLMKFVRTSVLLIFRLRVIDMYHKFFLLLVKVAIEIPHCSSIRIIRQLRVIGIFICFMSLF